MAQSWRLRFETATLSALFGVVVGLLVVDGIYAQSNPGPPPAGDSASLSPAQIQEAINFGSKFQTRDKFFEKGLKGVRVKLGPGVMGQGGMSRYVTFFDDWNWIASEAAAAKQQILDVSPADFHPTGMLHALLEVHAFGGAASQLNRKYLDDRSHLVIRAGGRSIQPASKGMLMRSDEESAVSELLFGGANGKITMRFEFQVTNEDLKMPTSVILSDGDGKRFEAKVDLSSVLIKH